MSDTLGDRAKDSGHSIPERMDEEAALLLREKGSVSMTGYATILPRNKIASFLMKAD